MSHLGKLPIILTTKINIKFLNGKCLIKGFYGILIQLIPRNIIINIKANILTILKKKNTKLISQQQGLIRTLLQNIIIGVSKKFEKKLQIFGIGYRAQINDNQLILMLGYSHKIILNIPKAITIRLESNTFLILSSIHKELVGSFSAKIRENKKPEPYKGKGIRYLTEKIKLKIGKSIKK